MKKVRNSKLLIALLVLTMSVWALAGCGGSGGGDANTEETTAPQETEQQADANMYTASEVTSDLSMADSVKAFYEAVDTKFGYDLAHELAYSEELSDFLGWRSAGSDSEHKTADYLVDKFKEIGIDDVEKIGTECDKFQFNSSSLKLKDTDIELTPASYQVNGTDGDLTAEMVDVGTGFEADYEGKDVEGKIVLAQVDQSNEAWIDGYARMANEKGAAAIVTWANSGYGESSPDTVNVQDVCCEDLIPITAISANEAEKVKKELEAGNTECTLNVDAEMVPDGGTTYNIVGKIPGKSDDQKIIISGHYDKYWYGFQDDGAAIALVFTIAKAMVDSGYQPENDIEFICHGAEEWGVTDSMYDWTTGAWGMAAHKDYGDDTLAMINCELPAFANENGLQIVSVPEYFSLISKLYDSGLIITNGDVAFNKEPVKTTTMEDGISYREFGVPYLLNGFEGSDFMSQNYHTMNDNEDTYDEDTFKTNIDWYGAYAIYIDTEPALELDLVEAANDLETNLNEDYAKEAGADTEAYAEAVEQFKAAGTALNEKIAACNEAYEAAAKDGDKDAMKKAREEGEELNDLSLEAFQKIQDKFLKVDDFTADYGHGIVNNNVETLDGTIAGLKEGVLWAEDDSGSGACDQILNLNSIHEYNYCIFSKDVASHTIHEYTPEYYKDMDQAQWGFKKQVPVCETDGASYDLFHAESMDDIDEDEITGKLTKARTACLDSIHDYCGQEIQDMKKIAKYINDELGDDADDAADDADDANDADDAADND